MNFFDAILIYRMDVIIAIKTRWIKFIILNVEITISVQKKNSKGTAKNRSKANTDGSSTTAAAQSGAMDASQIYFLPEHHTIRNNLSSK